MVEYEERNLTTKDSHRDEIIDALVEYDASTFIDIQKQQMQKQMLEALIL